MASALAQAALLHDVGKVGGRIQLGNRAATVLLNALRPGLLHRLALNEPDSWRYPFYVLLHHAERGADLAARAGTDAVAVALIREHHTVPSAAAELGQRVPDVAGPPDTLDAQGQALLVLLQRADGEN
jgi:hypothetical protein